MRLAATIAVILSGQAIIAGLLPLLVNGHRFESASQSRFTQWIVAERRTLTKEARELFLILLGAFGVGGLTGLVAGWSLGFYGVLSLSVLFVLLSAGSDATEIWRTLHFASRLLARRAQQLFFSAERQAKKVGRLMVAAPVFRTVVAGESVEIGSARWRHLVAGDSPKERLYRTIRDRSLLASGGATVIITILVVAWYAWLSETWPFVGRAWLYKLPSGLLLVNWLLLSLGPLTRAFQSYSQGPDQRGELRENTREFAEELRNKYGWVLTVAEIDQKRKALGEWYGEIVGKWKEDDRRYEKIRRSDDADAVIGDLNQRPSDLGFEMLKIWERRRDLYHYASRFTSETARYGEIHRLEEEKKKIEALGRKRGQEFARDVLEEGGSP